MLHERKNKQGNDCKWTWLCCLFLWWWTPSQAQIEPFPEKEVQLYLLTWNVQFLPRSMQIFSKALRKKQRVRLPWVIEHCQSIDYDVIVFQEVFDRPILKHLQKALQVDYPYQVAPLRQAGRWTSSGVLIVSKHPMEKVGGVVYPKGVSVDAWASKGCTLVRLNKNGEGIYIAGTHLQAGRKAKAQAQRLIQYRAIHELIETHTKTNTCPIIITGDFNTRASDRIAYHEMLEVLQAKDQAIDDPRPYTVDHQNTWNDVGKQQLDYVLWRSGRSPIQHIEQRILRLQKIWRNQPMDLSDHYGIAAQIRWSTSTGS